MTSISNNLEYNNISERSTIENGDINDVVLTKKKGFFTSFEKIVQNSNNQTSTRPEDQRKNFKLEKRQIEIFLYSENTEQCNFLIKKRLYLKNLEALNNIPSKNFKIEGINNSFNILTDAYFRVLDMFVNVKKKKSLGRSGKKVNELAI